MPVEAWSEPECVRPKTPRGGCPVTVYRPKPSPVWASLGLPGLALTSVLYSDAGRVFMCSTRVANGVLVIDTGKRKYGISPRDEDGFIAALTARLRGGAQ